MVLSAVLLPYFQKLAPSTEGVSDLCGVEHPRLLQAWGGPKFSASCISGSGEEVKNGGWGLNNAGEVLNKEWRKCRSLKDSPTEPCRNHTEAARPQSCLLNLLRGKAAWACQPPALSVTATVPSVTSAEAGRPHAGFWPPCWLPEGSRQCSTLLSSDLHANKRSTTAISCISLFLHLHVREGWGCQSNVMCLNVLLLQWTGQISESGN